MEARILYALIAGPFWGTSPVLVKRGLAGASVSAATLYVSFFLRKRLSKALKK